MPRVEFVADDNLKLTVPLGQFTENDINIQIDNNMVSLLAEKKIGAKGYKNTQKYIQRFELPDNVSEDCIKVYFTEDGSTLIIEAPYKECLMDIAHIHDTVIKRRNCNV